MTNDPWAPQPSSGPNNPSAAEDLDDMTVARSSLQPSPPPQPPAVVQFDDGTTESISGSTIIGRSPSRGQSGQALQVTLLDPQMGVSKDHLELDLVGGELVARDLGSTNQTTVVRGRATLPVPTVSWTTLNAGDHVKLGDTRSFIVVSVPNAAPDMTVARPSAAVAAPPLPPSNFPPASGFNPAQSAPMAASRRNCATCGDLLDLGVSFCVACGAPVPQASMAAGPPPPSGVPQAAPGGILGHVLAGGGPDAGSPMVTSNVATTPWFKRVPVLAGVGVLVVLALVAGFLLLGGDDDGGTASTQAGLDRVPTNPPTSAYELDLEGELQQLFGSPDALYAITRDGDDLELIAFDGAAVERWRDDLDGSYVERAVVTGATVVVSISDDEGDLTTYGYSTSGESFEFQSAGSFFSEAGRSYIYDDNSVDLVNLADGKTIASVRFDWGWRMTPGGVLTLEDEGTSASAFTHDLEPILEDVSIDEDESLKTIHNRLIVVSNEDELIGYGADGEVWSTRTSLSNITSATPLGGSRWLLLDGLDAEASVDSGVGEPNSRSDWTADAEGADVVRTNLILFSNSDDDGNQVSQLVDFDGTELVEVDGYFIPTANHAVFSEVDGGLIAINLEDGKELWSESGNDDGYVTMLDNGYAIVELDFGDPDSSTATIEVFR